MSSKKNSQIYVARFSRSTNEDDLNDQFKQFGKIKEISMKNGGVGVGVKLGVGVVGPGVADGVSGVGLGGVVLVGLGLRAGCANGAERRAAPGWRGLSIT